MKWQGYSVNRGSFVVPDLTRPVQVLSGNKNRIALALSATAFVAGNTTLGVGIETPIVPPNRTTANYIFVIPPDEPRYTMLLFRDYGPVLWEPLWIRRATPTTLHYCEISTTSDLRGLLPSEMRFDNYGWEAYTMTAGFQDNRLMALPARNCRCAIGCNFVAGSPLSLFIGQSIAGTTGQITIGGIDNRTFRRDQLGNLIDMQINCVSFSPGGNTCNLFSWYGMP